MAASGRQLGGVVLDGVVEQGGADDVGVLDVVVANDSRGNPQHVVGVGPVRAPVAGVEAG